MNRRLLWTIASLAAAVLLSIVLVGWVPSRPSANMPGQSDMRAPKSLVSAAPSRDEDAPEKEQAPAHSTVSFMRRDVTPSPRASWQPLPANNLPLAGIYSVLKSRADRGDALAACRLAAELGQCRKVVRMRDYPLHEFQPGIPAETPHAKALLETRSAHCSGVQKNWLVDEIGYTRQAALAGNLAAIEAYVSGEAITADLYAGTYYLEDYRREAPRLAEAALQAGSFGVLREYEGAFEYLAQRSLFSRAMDSEWHPGKQRQVWFLMGDILEGKSGERFRKIAMSLGEGDATSPETLALQRQSRTRFEQWFQGRKRPYSGGGFGHSAGLWNKADFNALCTGEYVDRPLEAQPIDWSMP